MTARKAPRSRSGKSLTAAQRTAAGRPVVSVSLPALTVAMLDALTAADGNRSLAVARAIAERYLRLHGTRAPWDVLGGEATAPGDSPATRPPAPR